MLLKEIDETKHLEQTRETIRKNIGLYTEQARVVKANVEDLNDRITPRDRELNSQMSQELSVASALLVHAQHQLNGCISALPSPYFGRIDYRDLTEHEDEVFYIGRHGIRDGEEIAVVDWRAPVAKVYYENEKGRGTYEAPENPERPIDLVNKRTFDIEDGTLRGFYDSDVAANDQLLVRYLAQHKDVVLSDIIATIQKEQDEIIRESPFKNIIVQGVAGSGKTTVALHRISQILYNYSSRFKSKDFLIIGGSDMLLSYIMSGLPDLEVEDVAQRRMDAFFRESLYEDFKPSYEIVEESDEGSFKCHLPFALALEKYLQKIWLHVLRPRAVVDEDLGELLSRDQVYEMLNLRRDWSLRRIEALLNETLRLRIEMKTDVRKEDAMYRKFHALRTQKLSEYERYYHSFDDYADAAAIYRTFLLQYGQENGIDTSGAQKAVQLGHLSVYDLAALCLVRRYFTEDEPDVPYCQIMVDEAQDFGEMVYYVMKRLQTGCYFTIMGDVSQNIHYETGMNDWNALREGVFSGPESEFRLLQKSYRNTIEISHYAGKILDKASGSQYKIDPVIRHGDPVDERSFPAEGEALDAAVRTLEKDLTDGFRSEAVICRSEDEARTLQEKLEMRSERLSEALKTEPGKEKARLMVLPIELCKGLEFDAVLIWQPDETRYPAGKTLQKSAKLLYVAATRALHRLHLLTSGGFSKCCE